MNTPNQSNTDSYRNDSYKLLFGYLLSFYQKCNWRHSIQRSGIKIYNSENHPEGPRKYAREFFFSSLYFSFWHLKILMCINSRSRNQIAANGKSNWGPFRIQQENFPWPYSCYWCVKPPTYRIPRSGNQFSNFRKPTRKGWI